MNVPSNLDNWVLAGQSNMEGCGMVKDSLPPDERVLCLTSAGNWDVASDPLHRLWESYTPVHAELMRPNLPEERRGLSVEELSAQDEAIRIHGAGLGLAFGRAMADASGKQVGLIPAAHGGTSLDQWSYKLKDQGGHSLYGAMLQRIERAGGNVKGILWYQGESDCDPEQGPTYAKRFDEWVAAVRSDLGIPNLPVIVVQLGVFAMPGDADGQWWDVVREAQRTLPERTPNTAVISAIDLGLDDSIHVNSAGQIRLGKRMARLALRLLGDSSIPAGPQVTKVERAKIHWDMGCLKVTCSGVTGKLQPGDHIPGFELRTADNKRHTTNSVMDARLHEDGTSIRMTLNAVADENTLLGYGTGLRPYCNLVDDADMPLLAFQGMEIA